MTERNGYQPILTTHKTPTPPNCGSALKKAAMLCTECLDYHIRKNERLEVENEKLREQLEGCRAAKEVYKQKYSRAIKIIQWHDLRKDPNDLPKGQINRFLFGYVKNYGGKKPMIICYNGEWFYDANTYNKEVEVIAWCEIPNFKEQI